MRADAGSELACLLELLGGEVDADDAFGRSYIGGCVEGVHP